MLRFLLSRYITRFERQWGYDASYMRELLGLSPWAFVKFGLVSSLGRGPAAPPAAIVPTGKRAQAIRTSFLSSIVLRAP